MFTMRRRSRIVLTRAFARSEESSLVIQMLIASMKNWCAGTSWEDIESLWGVPVVPSLTGSR